MKKIIKGFALFLSTLFLFSCSQQSSYQGKSEFSFKLPTAEMLKNVREATIDELSVDGSSEGEIGDEADEFSTFDDFTFHVYLFKEPDMVDRDKEKQSKDEQESYIMEGSFREEEIADSPDVELIEESEDYSFDLEQYFAEMKIEYSFYEYIGEKTGSAGESITFNSLNEGWYKIVLLGESKDYPYEFFQGFGGGEVIVGEESQVQITVEHWFICDACGWVYDQEWGAKECSNPDCPKNCKEEPYNPSDEPSDNPEDNPEDNPTEYKVDLLTNDDKIEFDSLKTNFGNYYYYAIIPISEKLGETDESKLIKASLSAYSDTDITGINAAIVSANDLDSNFTTVFGSLLKETIGNIFNPKTLETKKLNIIDFNEIKIKTDDKLYCILYYPERFTENTGNTITNKKAILSATEFYNSQEEQNGANIVKTKEFTNEITFSDSVIGGDKKTTYIAYIPLSDVISDEETINPGDTIVFLLEGKLNKEIHDLFFDLTYKNKSDVYPTDTMSFVNQINDTISPDNDGKFSLKLSINNIPEITETDTKYTALRLYIQDQEPIVLSDLSIKVVNYPENIKACEFSKERDYGILYDYYKHDTGLGSVKTGDTISVTIKGKFPEKETIYVTLFDNSSMAGGKDNYYKYLAGYQNGQNEQIGILNVNPETDEYKFTLNVTADSEDTEIETDGGKIMLRLRRKAENQSSSYTVTSFDISATKQD